MPYLHERYVDPQNGNDANAGTSWGSAWRTLPAAESLTPDDGRCRMASGRYSLGGTLHIAAGTNRLFTSEGRRAVVTGTKTDFALIEVHGTATDTVLEGWRVRPIGSGSGGAIWLAGTRNRVSRSRIISPHWAGLHLARGDAQSLDCVADYNLIVTLGPGGGGSSHQDGAVTINGNIQGTTLDHNTIICLGADAASHAIQWRAAAALSDGTTIFTNNVAACASDHVLFAAENYADPPFRSLYSGHHNCWSRVLGSTHVARMQGAPGDVLTTIADWRNWLLAEGEDQDAIDVDPLWTSVSRFFLSVGGTSPLLGTGVGGSDIGAFGEGSMIEETDDWGGRVWALGGGAEKDPAAKSIRLSNGSPGTARVSVLGAIPPGKVFAGFEVDVDETLGAGDVCRMLDRSDYVAGLVNPEETGVEVNAGAATGSYTNVERGATVSMGGGANVHFDFHLIADGRVEAP